MFYGPVKYIYTDKEFQRCQKNWWINFLFLNNHYHHDDMCYFTMWYLAADTQLYGISLICLITILKFKQMKILIMTLFLTIGLIIPCIVTYIYDLDIIYKILTPENSKNNNFLTFEFSASYTSTYANMATYILGLIFGYIYFRLENKTLLSNKVLVLLWWILSLGLPLTVIIISFYKYNRITSAILAGILRPLFASGIGVGIFGMSQKIGGFLKAACEWKPVVFLGTFTYSTYVVHFGIVFYRTGITMELLQVSDYILVTSFLQDTVLSFICGFLVHLLLEMPMSQLQQMFIPKYSVANNLKKRKTF